MCVHVCGKFDTHTESRAERKRHHLIYCHIKHCKTQGPAWKRFTFMCQTHVKVLFFTNSTSIKQCRFYAYAFLLCNFKWLYYSIGPTNQNVMKTTRKGARGLSLFSWWNFVMKWTDHTSVLHSWDCKIRVWVTKQRSKSLCKVCCCGSLKLRRADKWTKFMALYFEMTFRARVFYCLQTAGSPFFTIFRSIFLFLTPLAAVCNVSIIWRREVKDWVSSCHDLQVDER